MRVNEMESVEVMNKATYRTECVDDRCVVLDDTGATVGEFRANEAGIKAAERWVRELNATTTKSGRKTVLRQGAMYADWARLVDEKAQRNAQTHNNEAAYVERH